MSSSRSLYPFSIPADTLYPTRDKFEVFEVSAEIGGGVRCLTPIERGAVVARFVGQLVHGVLQHSLQVSKETHIHDPHFVGMLTHSCAPNAMLDMQRLEIIALADIEAGDRLTIDYATTEDRLFRQFPCSCGALNCRGWISGRRERVSDAGRRYLEALNGPQPDETIGSIILTAARAAKTAAGPQPRSGT